MKGGKRSELRRSQHSISYLLSSADASDPVIRASSQHLNELYPRRLLEDIYNHILPMRNKEAKISWEPLTSSSEIEMERLLTSALDRGDHQRDLAAAADQFIRECARMIMAYEEAPYEIVYFWQSNDENPQHEVLVGFKLVLIRPGTLMRRRKQVTQYVPLNIARQRNVKQHIPLPQDSLLIFKPPVCVQGKIVQMMRSLSALSSPIVPRFAFPAEDKLQKIPYDIAFHNRTKNFALAEATKLIGWNPGNSWFRKDVSDFYFYHRHLLFARFMIELRESILTTLNEGLNRAGDEMGFSGYLKFQGMPTVADIMAAQSHLLEGNQTFEGILKPFL